MIRRRSAQTFSLSFLDCICCGFGAIILIFVLTIGSREREKLEVLRDLQRALAGQLEKLLKLEAQSDDLVRTQRRLNSLVVEARKNHADVLALAADLERELQREKAGLQALLVERDELRKDVPARQKPQEIKLLPDGKPTPVGLPTYSNYIAVVIDTSGSMRDPNHGGLWPKEYHGQMFTCNLHGNPGISVPAGTVDGLPVGLQIIGRHFSEQVLLDLALVMERTRPWPLVAPGSPA